MPTADDYILTTFHITGKVGQAPVDIDDTLGSVLIQHGNLQDAASWLAGFGDDHKPFQLQLVDEGYDIWLGNNRGTEYSQGHQTLSSDDAAFWDFNWTAMGMYDDPANISAIKKATGQDKIQYIGYSQGTVQMHYALAHDEDNFYGESLHRVIQLAPCFYPNVPNIIWNTISAGTMRLHEFGVHSLFGKNWEQDLKTICDNVDAFTCSHYRGLTGSQPISVKSEQYWAQLGMNNGFYEPVTMEQWANGVYHGDAIDVSKINQVPMSFFIGGSDNLCKASFANEYISQMHTTTEVWTISGKEHSYFSGDNYTASFMNHLVQHLDLHW